MTKPFVPLLAGAALLIAAVALNPSAERHRSRIKDSIGDRSPLEKVLGIGHLTAFASSYHSVGIGSYTTVNGKLTSVGAFGMVFAAE